VDACPTSAIYLVEGIATIDTDRCDDCGVCVDACPHEAIRVTPQASVEVVSAPAPAPRPSIQPVIAQRSTLRSALWPWIGAALAFTAREVVPRVVNELLVAWDRRVSQSSPTAPSLRDPPPLSPPGHQRRRRHRGGN
jgi:Fe-S-cluster-containing hydrogenase component 2